MKLVINIPCFNEEKTLPLVLAELPKEIIGIDEVEYQIVDDGSKDKTVEIAKNFGCHVIRHIKNRGLGWAFKSGMNEALSRGCDIFVNTDGDNQYPSKYIPELIRHIINDNADIVIGNRNPWKVKHFSPLKRILQYVGNGFMRKVLGIDVPDTVSGFRAYSREALLRINVVTQFSYVLDTIMQASQKGLKVENIDIETNAPTRKSRLFKNMFQHIRKSLANMIRLFYLYEPFKTFSFLSLMFFVPGLSLGIRFLYFYFRNEGTGHIQSLLLATISILGSILMFGFAIIGDSLKTNRILKEDELYMKKKYFFGNNIDED